MDRIFPEGYRVTDTHVFFYGSFLSNFQKCSFEWTFMGETHEFFCTEQAFMWAKARLFNDPVMSKAILSEKDDPLECKHCGRWVQGYDDKKWAEVRYKIMLDVNTAKYTKDKEMQKLLLNPLFDGKEFVEASPSDGIWGIKMGIGEKGVENPRNWKGTNLLGKVITEVRNSLLQKDLEVV